MKFEEGGYDRQTSIGLKEILYALFLIIAIALFGVVIASIIFIIFLY